MYTMRAKIKWLIWVLVAIMMMPSCEKDTFEAFLKKRSYSPEKGMIWDIGPVYFQMEVTDVQGNNLFSETTPGNWLSEQISATFDGKEFLWPSARTKAYLAVLKGFYLLPRWYKPSDEMLFCFGELDGTKKWDKDLCITWPDGSTDVIRVQHAFRWNLAGQPEQYTGFKLNGVPIDGGIIHLSK